MPSARGWRRVAETPCASTPGTGAPARSWPARSTTDLFHERGNTTRGCDRARVLLDAAPRQPRADPGAERVETTEHGGVGDVAVVADERDNEHDLDRGDEDV